MIQATVMLGLATFVICYFLRELDGPYDMFLIIRSIILKDDNDGNPKTFLGKLFACHWCLSTWVALMVLPIYNLMVYHLILQEHYSSFFVWLGAIAISGLVYSVIER